MRTGRSPFQELNDLRSHMNRLLDGESAQFWAPVVDVLENENEIILEAELPGMKKDEIDIQLDDGALILRGERKIESSQNGPRFLRMERQYGAWRRSFQIEVPIDVERINADYTDGVLTVRLPKLQESQARRIEIRHES